MDIYFILHIINLEQNYKFNYIFKLHSSSLTSFLTKNLDNQKIIFVFSSFKSQTSTKIKARVETNIFIINHKIKFYRIIYKTTVVWVLNFI